MPESIKMGSSDLTAPDFTSVVMAFAAPSRAAGDFLSASALTTASGNPTDCRADGPSFLATPAKDLADDSRIDLSVTKSAETSIWPSTGAGLMTALREAGEVIAGAEAITAGISGIWVDIVSVVE